jgi:hypothetical protein
MGVAKEVVGRKVDNNRSQAMFVFVCFCKMIMMDVCRISKI